jgi:hypothetical protein
MELNDNKIKQIQDHKKIEIDFSYQKLISFSQYQMFTQCPYRWKLQYVDKIKDEIPNMYAIFGTAIHETLQNYLKVMYGETAVAANNIEIENQFKDTFINLYKENIKKNSDNHFSDPAEMRDFYEDGIAIINYFKKNRNKYFSKKGWVLVGIEIPILHPVNDTHKNLYMRGYLDVVLYNQNSKEITIIDIKTSYMGWGVKNKKDQVKTSQLILYKKFLSEQHNIPIDNINIQYFIVKRKIWEESTYPQSRIQIFEPPSGKVKQNKLSKDLNDFINHCFTLDGKPNKDQTYLKTPSKDSCAYCPFSNNFEICDKNKLKERKKRVIKSKEEK